MPDRPKYGDYENLSNRYDEAQRYNLEISSKLNKYQNCIQEIVQMSEKAHITTFELKRILAKLKAKLSK